MLGPVWGTIAGAIVGGIVGYVVTCAGDNIRDQLKSLVD